MRLKNAQFLKEHAKKYSKLWKCKELLFWLLYKIMEICFSANVHQCNIAF